MNKVYLSKSRYCKCIQCNKIIWADRIVQTKSKTINAINKVDIENALHTIKNKEEITRKIGSCG